MAKKTLKGRYEILTVTYQTDMVKTDYSHESEKNYYHTLCVMSDGKILVKTVWDSFDRYANKTSKSKGTWSIRHRLQKSEMQILQDMQQLKGLMHRLMHRSARDIKWTEHK